MQTADVVIIGGGIWGLSTAYHLAQRQLGRILVLEQTSELALETTSQSAGQVGQLRGDPLLARAVGYTLQLLGEFKARTGHDPGFVRSGSVHLAIAPPRVAQFEKLAAAARDIGYCANPISASDVLNLAPRVRSNAILAALHVPNDGYVDARAAALAYGAAARDLGAEILLGQAVTEISNIGEQVTIRTSTQSFETNRLVLAGGPWTQALTRHFGFVAPMYPIRLQQARTARDGVAEQHPVLRVPDESCYVRPENGGYLFGFFDPDPLPIDLSEKFSAFRTADVQPEPALIQQATARLDKVLPRLGRLAIEQYRQGMMTCTPDGRFVIGPLPEQPHVFVATGCGGTGIAASAAIGRWLADSVVDGQPHEDLTAYAPSRFAANAHDSVWLRESARATSAAYYRLPVEA